MIVNHTTSRWLPNNLNYNLLQDIRHNIIAISENNASWICSISLVFNVLIFKCFYIIISRTKSHKSGPKRQQEFCSSCCVFSVSRKCIYNLLNCTPPPESSLDKRPIRVTERNCNFLICQCLSSFTCFCTPCSCFKMQNSSSVTVKHGDEPHSGHYKHNTSSSEETIEKINHPNQKLEVIGPIWLLKAISVVEILIQGFLCVITSRLQRYFYGITWCRIYNVLDFVLFTYLHWLESLFYIERSASLFSRYSHIKSNYAEPYPETNVSKYFSVLRLKIGFTLFAIITTVLAHNYIGVLRFENNLCMYIGSVYYFFKLFLMPVTAIFKEIAPICIQSICLFVYTFLKIRLKFSKCHSIASQRVNPWPNDSILDLLCFLRIIISLVFRYPCAVMPFLMDYRGETLALNVWKGFLASLITCCVLISYLFKWHKFKTYFKANSFFCICSKPKPEDNISRTNTYAVISQT